MVNLQTVKKCLDVENRSITKARYGVLGIGNIGSQLVINLSKIGKKVYIWNRTTKICEQFLENLHSSFRVHVEILHIPTLLMHKSDIIFNCVSDCNQSKSIIEGSLKKEFIPNNVLEGKGLVDLSGMNADNQKELNRLVKEKKRKTFGGKNSTPERYVTKLHLIQQLIKSIVLSGISEGRDLVERLTPQESYKTILDIFFHSNSVSAYVRNKCNLIYHNFDAFKQSLSNLGSELTLALKMSDSSIMPILSLLIQTFKHCKKLGYGDKDSAAIFMRFRH